MTITALKLTTRVLPGNRIEFVAPELPEGVDVEVFVALPESGTNGHTETTGFTRNGESTSVSPVRKYASALEYLDSLTPIERTPEEWAAIERELQEEKNSWER